MVEFYDGWETAQTWNVLWSAVVNRVTTDPFQGSYCVQMDDPTNGGPAGLSKDNIFDPTEDEYLRIAVKNASATHGAEVYIYTPDHSRLAFLFRIEGAGAATYLDNLGVHTLYGGSLNTWYEFRIVIKWAEQKFDIAVYDRNGNKLAEAKDRVFYNGTYIETLAHILLYSSIAGTGTAYYDGVSVVKYLPPIPPEIDVVEGGIFCVDKLVEPSPVMGHWILDIWVRHVRDIYDKTLADDHNIPRLVLIKAKDIESTKQ